MKKLLALILVTFLLFPISEGFGQLSNTLPTLGVKLTSTAPFSYKDDNGYTIVIGEVENTKNFAVTNVKVWAGFYSGQASGPKGSAPLESATGKTLLDVIPPHSKSPFVIKSNTANPQINEVSVNMLGFNSATEKQQSLQIMPGALSVGNTVKLVTEIKNNGAKQSTQTLVHLIAFDTFQPPRIVGIQTLTVDDLEPGKSTIVKFDTLMDYRASSFKIIAESKEYQSTFTDVSKVTLDTLTRLVSINSVDTVDSSGKHVSQIKVGTPINITSNLSVQYSALAGANQPFVYYVQVKEFGKNALVEFLGTAEGTFDSDKQQNVSVGWTPEHEGGFFVETYVWDPDGVALAAPSKTVSIILVTS